MNQKSNKQNRLAFSWKMKEHKKVQTFSGVIQKRHHGQYGPVFFWSGEEGEMKNLKRFGNVLGKFGNLEK